VDAFQLSASQTKHSDAVFKTFVEAALLIVFSLAHLIVGFSFAAVVVGSVLLVVISLACDVYLFGSIGRAFAARRAFHFKASPFIVAATALFFIMPAENEADRFVRWLLAAGIGGVVTGLLNLSKKSDEYREQTS
jgi:hypothetical protein